MDLMFVGEVGSWQHFDLLADGDRPVLELWVDLADPLLQIYIASVGGGLEARQSTKGVVHTHVVDSTENGDVGMRKVICAGSLVGYVIPRAVTLMARVYVPTGVYRE